MSELENLVPSGVVLGDDVQKVFAYAKAHQFALPAVNCTGTDTVTVGTTSVVGAEECRSALRVPVLRGERMVAFIVLENYEREQAYGEPELRLVCTIAASMGGRTD